MTTDAVGGVWGYSLELAAGLTQHGAEVLLATLGPAPSEQQIKQAAALSGVTLRTGGFALEWMLDSWEDVDASGRWLLDLQEQYRANLIHLNGYCHASLPWHAPVVVAAHSCVYSWWRAVHGTPPGGEWDEYWRRVSDGLSAADAVVCPSEFMARAIQGEYGTASEKIRVIHNFLPDAANPAHGEKQPFFLGAGRVWDKAKNFALLDHIAAKLAWEIRVAGGNQDPDGSERNARHLKLLGALDHARLLDLMKSAAVFVHPALYEPFGLSVLEAARARCALVLADIPSLRELWDGAAVFVNPRDPDAWTFELDQLSRDREKRERLAGAAFSHAARYEAQRAVSAYCALYAELIRQKREQQPTSPCLRAGFRSRALTLPALCQARTVRSRYQ
ncbi:MAG TPA: glycosyltransferase [Bryobacteraceae bacterium]|jgi:glycosyltransferase involved in cell wall biosynthesis|nr:glycosyltransferase [Bryobacteraceae bacterium]